MKERKRETASQTENSDLGCGRVDGEQIYKDV